MKKVRVLVKLKQGVLDPQGKAVKHALHDLGFNEAQNVRIGKIIELEIDPSQGKDPDERIKAMCEKLLVNPVMEDYEIIGV